MADEIEQKGPEAEAVAAEGAPAAEAVDQWWLNDQVPLQFAQGADTYQANNALTYHLKGRPAFAFVDINIPEGQSILGDGGAMLWMDGHVQMNTWCWGGLCNAYCRQCSGETFCQNKFTGPGNVTFGFLLPGDMLPFAVAPGNGWIVTNQAFVCGTENVNVSTRWSGCGACLCGGEGPFMTKVVSNGDGNGMFFAGGYGSLERHDIQEGKELFVDNGLFFAAHETCQISIGMPGGCNELCFSGEGLVMKFQGPAVVYTQSRDPSIFYALYRPPKEEDSEDNSGNQGGGNND